MNSTFLHDRLVRLLLVLLTLAVALYLSTQVWHLLQSVGDVILLFFFAWLVAFTLRPLARAFQRLGLRTWALSVATVYLGLGILLVLLIVLVIPQIIEQLTQFVLTVPDLAARAGTGTTWLQNWLASYNIDVDLTSIYRTQDVATRAEGIATSAVQNSVALLTGLASGLFAAVVVLFLSFYIMIDDDGLVRDLLVFIPERYHAEAIYLGDSIDQSFGGFMRGQLIQAVVYGAGTAIVMQLFQLPFVLLASTFAGVVMVVPIFGSYVAVIPPLLIAAFQGDVTRVVILLIALVILQQLVLSFMMPRIMAQTVGVPPLGIFAAILFGTKLAGIAGAFFGVPIVGIIAAMLKLYTERRRGVDLAVLPGPPDDEIPPQEQRRDAPAEPLRARR